MKVNGNRVVFCWQQRMMSNETVDAEGGREVGVLEHVVQPLTQLLAPLLHQLPALHLASVLETGVVLLVEGAGAGALELELYGPDLVDAGLEGALGGSEVPAEFGLDLGDLLLLNKLGIAVVEGRADLLVKAVPVDRRHEGALRLVLAQLLLVLQQFQLFEVVVVESVEGVALGLGRVRLFLGGWPRGGGGGLAEEEGLDLVDGGEEDVPELVPGELAVEGGDGLRESLLGADALEGQLAGVADEADVAEVENDLV
jgi:hypothetical protein